MTLRRRLVGLGTAAIIAAVLGGSVAIAGWTQDSPADNNDQSVSEAEARVVLAGLVRMADDQDWAGLCSVRGAEGLGCDSVQNGEVTSALRRAKPADPPTVLAGHTFSGDECFLPGFVLELEGLNGLGVRYRSDLFVARDYDGEFLVSMPVYWYGGRFFATTGCSKGS